MLSKIDVRRCRMIIEGARPDQEEEVPAQSSSLLMRLIGEGAFPLGLAIVRLHNIHVAPDDLTRLVRGSPHLLLLQLFSINGVESIGGWLKHESLRKLSLTFLPNLSDSTITITGTSCGEVLEEAAG